MVSSWLGFSGFTLVNYEYMIPIWYCWFPCLRVFRESLQEFCKLYSYTVNFNSNLLGRIQWLFPGYSWTFPRVNVNSPLFGEVNGYSYIFPWTFPRVTVNGELPAINGANQINRDSHNLWILVGCLYINYVPQDFALISFNTNIHNSTALSIHVEPPSINISTYFRPKIVVLRSVFHIGPSVIHHTLSWGLSHLRWYIF